MYNLILTSQQNNTTLGCNYQVSLINDSIPSEPLNLKNHGKLSIV